MRRGDWDYVENTNLKCMEVPWLIIDLISSVMETLSWEFIINEDKGGPNKLAHLKVPHATTLEFYCQVKVPFNSKCLKHI